MEGAKVCDFQGYIIKCVMCSTVTSWIPCCGKPAAILLGPWRGASTALPAVWGSHLGERSFAPDKPLDDYSHSRQLTETFWKTLSQNCPAELFPHFFPTGTFCFSLFLTKLSPHCPWQWPWSSTLPSSTFLSSLSPSLNFYTLVSWDHLPDKQLTPKFFSQVVFRENTNWHSRLSLAASRIPTMFY